jgi:hypothetical protein
MHDPRSREDGGEVSIEKTLRRANNKGEKHVTIARSRDVLYISGSAHGVSVFVGCFNRGNNHLVRLNHTAVKLLYLESLRQQEAQAKLTLNAITSYHAHLKSLLNNEDRRAFHGYRSDTLDDQYRDQLLREELERVEKILSDRIVSVSGVKPSFDSRLMMGASLAQALCERYLPKREPVRCPSHPNLKGELAGCGSTNVSGPDDEGFYDCHDCGLFFKAGAGE